MNHTFDLDLYDAEREAHLTYVSKTGRIMIGAVSCTVATFGVFANIINITVFRCQGFQDTVNISLMALAASDLLTLMSIINFNCTVINELTDQSILPQDFSYPASWVVYACAFCSSWIAVYISVERCLCVALPLKVKDIITPKVAVISLALIVFITLGSVVPALSSMRLKALLTSENVTFVGIGFTEDRVMLESITYIFVIFLQNGSFVCLFLSTIILIVSLKRKVKQRLEKLSAAQTGTMESKESKEDRVVRMVVVVSLIILFCFSPAQILSLITIFRPQFDFGKEEAWIYRIMWAAVYFFYSSNASLNIFIYYQMSSRYRNTLNSIVDKAAGYFGCCDMDEAR